MSFNIINLSISYYLLKTRFKTLMSLKVQKKQAKITIKFISFIRSRKWNNVRQYNSQSKKRQKDKWRSTKHCTENIRVSNTNSAKKRTRYSGRVSTSCATSGTQFIYNNIYIVIYWGIYVESQIAMKFFKTNKRRIQF